MPFFTSAKNRLLAWRILLALSYLGGVALLWWEAGRAAEEHVAAEVAAAQVSVDYNAASLRNSVLAAMRHLHGIAGIVAKDRDIVEGVVDGQQKQSLLNRRLADLAEQLNVEVAWILDAEGLCIASSNAGTEGSFVGVRYSDRHYYKQALRGEKGFQYAVGRVSNLPGFFFSAPIDGGPFMGAVVVKIDLPNLSWLDHADGLILDSLGAVIMATKGELVHSAMATAPLRTTNPHKLTSIYKRTEFPTLNIEASPSRPGIVLLEAPSLKPAPMVIGRAEIREYGLSVITYRHITSLSRLATARLERMLRHTFLLTFPILIIGLAQRVAKT